MAKRPRVLFRSGSLRALLLPALTVTAGLQLVRVFYPSLVWYLKDARGAHSLSLALYAFAAFLAVFLAAILRRLIGPRLALWLTAGGLALVRVCEQLVTAPSVDLWLSLVGTSLFVLFLPIWLGHVRGQAQPHRTPRLAYGLLLGFALDSAIKGLAGTLDLSWISGWPALAVVLAMAAAILWLLLGELMPAADAPSEGSWSEALPLLTLGPMLMLQSLVFQNQGWVAEVGGVGMPEAFVLVMAGNVLAIVGLVLCLARPAVPWWGALAAAAYLILVSLAPDRQGAHFVLILGMAQFAMGGGWGVVVCSLRGGARRGLSRVTVLVGVGLVLYLVLSFFYYVSLDIAVPVPRVATLPAAAGLVGACWVYAAARQRGEAKDAETDKTGLVAVDALLLVAFAAWALAGQEPEAVAPAGFPVRVMTYNIHSAYNSEGWQDPEAIAQVIEDSGADIVALQEVSRGWLIDGATDLPGWLSRRLGMPYVFRGTADLVWGNAILSRYPMLGHGWGRLPLSGTLLPRGYVWAAIEVGGQEPLLVIATHLHHIESEHGPRLAQVPVLLDFWAGRPTTVLLGDLNSRPGFPEMDLIAQAGFVDSWVEAGDGDGYSWPAVDAWERIDWVWHTPDLVARRAITIDTAASDHLPVLVTLETTP